MFAVIREVNWRLPPFILWHLYPLDPTFYPLAILVCAPMLAIVFVDFTSGGKKRSKALKSSQMFAHSGCFPMCAYRKRSEMVGTSKGSKLSGSVGSMGTHTRPVLGCTTKGLFNKWLS